MPRFTVTTDGATQAVTADRYATEQQSGDLVFHDEIGTEVARFRWYTAVTRGADE